MRKLSPNFDHEYALDTVLEVPIPEESFSTTKNNPHRKWHKWMKPSTKTPPFGGKNAEIQLVLGAIGALVIPFSIKADSNHHSINNNVKDIPIEVSMAKYIVKQYVAAVGGETALNSIESMYAMGKVKMAASEFCSGEENLRKKVKVRKLRNGDGEIGGFVLWQKRPELWCLEMVVSGCKISAGSDGKVGWRQSPWHHSHASSGPPKPLRRFFQGLDPRSTAKLFSNSVCIGEKTINKEDCFVLKLESEPSKSKTGNLDIIRHTICGYFSQKTGLLVHLEDSHLVKIKSSDCILETTTESSIQDYRNVDGISIAHAGKTQVNLVKYGENSSDCSRTRMEEIWEIEEVDFNIKGLSVDCFLPPGDLKKEEMEGCGVPVRDSWIPVKTRGVSSRISVSNKIVAVDVYDCDESDEDDEEL